MIEHEILTKAQLRKIAEIIGKCQCGVKCLPTPHRINRGYAGGKYILRNLMWFCKCCHNDVHAHEGRRG